MVMQLVKQLYSRDSRHKFCPEQHWLATRAAISNESVDVSEYLKSEDEKEHDEAINKPGMSTLNARNLAILKYIPFAIPFLQRVKVSRLSCTVDTKYF